MDSARTECFGIRSAKVSLVDVALAPSSTVLRYRTILVRRSQRWDVVEHNQRDSDAQGSNPLPNPELVDEVLTLGHAIPCTPCQLGFAMKRPVMSLLDPIVPEMSVQAGQPEDADAEVIAGPDEVVIDGVRLDAGSSLAALCASLGVSTHGNKAQLFKRMLKHLE